MKPGQPSPTLLRLQHILNICRKSSVNSTRQNPCRANASIAATLCCLGYSEFKTHLELEQRPAQLSGQLPRRQCQLPGRHG